MFKRGGDILVLFSIRPFPLLCLKLGFNIRVGWGETALGVRRCFYVACVANDVILPVAIG